jgi:multicomponent Na+:H+ antiporter subunit D
MYFLPIIYRAWFVAPDLPGQEPREATMGLLAPAIVTAAASVAVGIGAGLAVSPLSWVIELVDTFYAATGGSS